VVTVTIEQLPLLHAPRMTFFPEHFRAVSQLQHWVAGRQLPLQIWMPPGNPQVPPLQTSQVLQPVLPLVQQVAFETQVVPHTFAPAGH
jgi:hypothetical protein